MSVASLLDITERKRAEEALRESEERFRAVFDSAEDSVFIKDRNLKYTQVNPAMERLFELPASELIGRTDKDLFGQEAGAHIRQIDSRVLGGETVEGEHAKPVKGVTRTFHVIKVPMRDADGEITGLCGIARDVTERKRAEEALRESEEKYRTTFESTGTATIIIEEDTTLSMVNSQFEKLSGYSKKEIEGKKSWTEFIVKDDLERMKEYHRLRRIAEDSAPGSYEFRFIDKYGVVKDIFLTSNIIPGTKKSVASLLDITERK
jgi:PAS domain S-box-containing protein